MVYLQDLFDMDLFRTMLDDGYISARQHPTDDLTIYNYTPKAQYANEWNPVTMQCRGLIADGMDRIIARPWAKFFNYGQPLAPEIPLHATVTAMDKADGSLGIIYRTSHGLAVATRGSFTSEQAIHATEVLRRYPYKSYLEFHMHKFTPLVEIVYPENRVVLDYGQRDELVLLGAVSVASGVYLDAQEAQKYFLWAGPVTDTIAVGTFSDALSLEPRPNAEGLVVRYMNSLVKIKQEDYLELHRARFNTTPRRVWEQLAEGKSIKEIVEVLPDEFQPDVKAMAVDISNAYISRIVAIQRDYYALIDHFGGQYNAVQTFRNDRGAIAAYLRGTGFAADVFNMLDGRHKLMRERAWKMVRPRVDK